MTEASARVRIVGNPTPHGRGTWPLSIADPADVASRALSFLVCGGWTSLACSSGCRPSSYFDRLLSWCNYYLAAARGHRRSSLLVDMDLAGDGTGNLSVRIQLRLWRNIQIEHAV